MKTIRRLLALGIIASLSLLFVSTTARAQSVVLTEGDTARITANCQSVKSSLNQLHATDALLRVNRGQVYEAMASKLMEPFNARLNNNRLDSKATSAVLSSYRSALDTFRSDYQLYEQQLSFGLRIDCQKQPEAFYRALEEARSRRAVVRADVLRLNRYIDDYRSAVSDFWLNYQRTNQ